jgi:hypothetical protein
VDTANGGRYPLLPGPKLVSGCSRVVDLCAEQSAAQFLWNFFWSSTDDRCDRAEPTGERDLFDWENTILEQDTEPSFCYGLFRETPWSLMTPNRECSPEQAALHEDNIRWWELTTPLPFDRFKRDVFELASRLSRSVDWYLDAQKTPYEHFQEETDSQASVIANSRYMICRRLISLALQQYERVFVTPLDEMGERGPESSGMFHALTMDGWYLQIGCGVYFFDCWTPSRSSVQPHKKRLGSYGRFRTGA